MIVVDRMAEAEKMLIDGVLRKVITAKTGVTNTTLTRLCHKLGIVRKKCNRPKHKNEAQILADINSGYCVEYIAKNNQCSPATVAAVRARYNAKPTKQTTDRPAA